MNTTIVDTKSVTTKEAVVSTLLDLGIKYAFTLPGLGVTWMLDEFYKTRNELRVVLTRSEQTASIMAQVVGRLTGKPGLYMGQGPFASTTGAFGVLEAYFSGSPMVVLTDTSCYDGFGMHGVYQTMTGDYGAADVRNVFKTITKSTWYACEPHESIYALQQAYKQASLPRQGPCAVVLKSSIIKRELGDQTRITNYPSAGYLKASMPKADPAAIAKLAEMLNESKKPVLIAGNGMQNQLGRQLVADFASRYGIAVATSYNGKGIVDETSDISVGMLGTWGMKSANQTVREADLIIAIGASLGPDYIRFREPDFIRPGQQKIIQIDIDPRNAGWVYPVDLAICADGNEALEQLLEHGCDSSQRSDRMAWISIMQTISNVHVQDCMPTQGKLGNYEIIHALDSFLTEDELLTLDAGTNRIWATTQLKIRTPGQLIVPGGIGGMGWGLQPLLQLN